jgi:hypothetical protein
VTNGTISLPTRYVLAIVPFVIRRPWSSGLGWPGLSGVVAFPKLSKLLNQEDALSAPCLQHFRGKFCSPQAAPSRGAGMLRTGGTLHFDVTLPFWITESSCSQAPMSPRWWWQMHGQSAPVQGQAGPSWQGGADVWRSYSHNSTVFGRRREGKKNSLVTTIGRCFFIIAQRGDCRCGRLLSLNLVDGTWASFPQVNVRGTRHRWILDVWRSFATFPMVETDPVPKLLSRNSCPETPVPKLLVPKLLVPKLLETPRPETPRNSCVPRLLSLSRKLSWVCRRVSWV